MAAAAAEYPGMGWVEASSTHPGLWFTRLSGGKGEGRWSCGAVRREWQERCHRSHDGRERTACDFFLGGNSEAGDRRWGWRDRGGE